MKISLQRRHALTAVDGAFSHKIDYVTIFLENLNPEGHPNRITGSKVTSVLLNRWILPIGGALSGRVCACSLRPFSKHWPSGPMLSISLNVRLSVRLSVRLCVHF